MKIRSAGLITLAVLFLGVTLSGCVSSGRPQDASQNVMRIAAVEAKALPSLRSRTADPSAQAVAGGANDFAFALGAALAKDAGGKNLVCSPYSVWLPLVALVNATDDQYKAQLLSALHAAGVSAADVNNAAARMLFDITREGDKYYAEENGGDFHSPLKIANAIFVRNDVTLKKSFAQTFMDYYRGSMANVDFSSQGAVDAVNQWASDNTEGLITDIVESFDPETVAAIANAIYFSDRWKWEFNPGQTKEDVFHSPAGETKAFYMLREGNDQRYYEDDSVQAMPLRFLTGGGLYIILPKDGDAAGLLASMTGEYFEKIQNDSIYATGKLLLPRFSMESDLQLKDMLAALGVPLFDASAAPLTGGLIEGETPVWLSSAVHKAAINVDEKGTTAAAVTVLAAPEAMPPKPTEPFEMNCNKPFVFILYGSTYDGGNQVLFTGMVNQP